MAMLPTDTLVARILWLQAISGITSREDLSRACGLARSHLGLVVSGHIRAFRPDVAEKIAEAIGVSATWVLFGTGPAPKLKLVRDRLAKAHAMILEEREAKKRATKNSKPKAA